MSKAIFRSGLTAVSLACALIVTPVFADEITDSIEEATAAYEAGDLSKASENLAYAMQLLQQMKGERLGELLPEPLDGWTAEEVESTAVGASMFGGGLTVERKYKKEKSQISVQIVTDSPLLQSMMAMFSNPMFAGSSGGKLQKINGQKAIVTYKEKRQRGEYKFMVANRYMVTIAGRKVSQDDLEAYAEAMDFSQFE